MRWTSVLKHLWKGGWRWIIQCFLLKILHFNKNRIDKINIIEIIIELEIVLEVFILFDNGQAVNFVDSSTVANRIRFLAIADVFYKISIIFWFKMFIQCTCIYHVYNILVHKLQGIRLQVRSWHSDIWTWQFLYNSGWRPRMYSFSASPFPSSRI